MAHVTSLSYPFPIPRTHCGVPLGNGSLGVLVWGRDRLHLTVNRADFWDHRGGELLAPDNDYRRLAAAFDPSDGAALHAAFRRTPRPPGALRSSRLPVGRFELVLRDGLQPAAAVLHPQTGLLVVEVRGGPEPAALTLAVSPTANLLYIADPDGLIERAMVRPSWDWVGAELARHGFAPPVVLSADGLSGWVQPCPADPALAAVGRSVAGGWACSLALGPGADEATSSALAALAALDARGAASLLAETTTWWRAFWSRCPQLELPDPWWARFVTAALWRFGCATSPHSPLPAGLQGPWIEEYQLAPWSGDYHLNVNLQQMYALAFPTGLYDHLDPLFAMLERHRPVMQHNAQVLFGDVGGLVTTHAVDDLGRQCGGISSGAVLDQACAAWLGQLYLQYVEHTGDEAFARDVARPFLTGVFNAYWAMLEEREGRLSMPLSISAEYAQPLPGGRRQNAGRDPSSQLAACRYVAEQLLALATAAGEPPDPRWTRVLEELPPVTLVGEPGDQRIGVWEGQDLDLCHRHHSHLSALYPFDTLDDDPETWRILDNSLDHWILKGMGQWSEWCLPWAAILQTRAGLSEAPRVLLNLWREVFVNEGDSVVYLPRFRGLTAHRRADLTKPKETTEIMQLDGCFGAVTALYEMLCHTRRGQLRVFWGAPTAWPDLAFHYVRAPGGFVVSGTRRGGRTTEVVVAAKRSGRLRLAVPDRPQMRLERGGSRRLVELPFDAPVDAGDILRFTPGD